MTKTQREIKYRFRDNEGRFHFFTLVDLCEGRAMSWASAGTILEHTPPDRYTGLKDKNGKEIYEGDVVRGVGKDIIIYDQDRFKCEHWEDLLSDLLDEIEVIGNIYENPELLK